MKKEILLEKPPQQFISKSFVIEAIQYNGKNESALFKFCPELLKPKMNVNHIHLIIGERVLPVLQDCWVGKDNEGRYFVINDVNFKNGFDPLNS